MNDPVNHPSHYTFGKVEIIDIIHQIAKHYPAEIAYDIGAAIKYIARAPHKGKLEEDLRKAMWMLGSALKSDAARQHTSGDPVDATTGVAVGGVNGGGNQIK